MSNYKMLDNIKVYEQNSIRISSENGVIYVDPFRIPSEMHDADYILITHDHYGHFSTEDIEKVAGKESVLVLPLLPKNASNCKNW